MINGKKILALITARGGSKGIHRKNIVDFCGKPLIAWTIDEAKKSGFVDRLILSSEDAEIIETARKYGCEVPFVRPRELSGDEVSGTAPVIHAIKTISGYDYVVLLQPTSPLRIAEDIDGCIRKCVESGADSCVSVAELAKPPFWVYTLGGNDIMAPLIKTPVEYKRRQDFPKTYALNGAVYVAGCDWILKNDSFVGENTAGYVMPESRSIDIDTMMDLRIAELIKNGASKKSD